MGTATLSPVTVPITGAEHKVNLLLSLQTGFLWVGCSRTTGDPGPPLPGDTWQCWETFLLDSAAGGYGVGAGDDTQDSPLGTEKDPAQNVNVLTIRGSDLQKLEKDKKVRQ